MDLNQFTQMSRQAVTDGQAIARRLQHNEVETWHLLSALLGQENGIVPGLLEKMNVHYAQRVAAGRGPRAGAPAQGVRQRGHVEGLCHPGPQ
jgi:ATP-dependent Clp protease ATP-binding subunit ClpA